MIFVSSAYNNDCKEETRQANSKMIEMDKLIISCKVATITRRIRSTEKQEFYIEKERSMWNFNLDKTGFMSVSGFPGTRLV